MKIVLITHPSFIGSQSMPRYANWLTDGMKKRGHQVEVWQPNPYFHRLNLAGGLRKWMGYLDQYALFPLVIKRKIKLLSDDTIFVFSDHALGPWIPLLKNRAHAIHCHDFLAQLSSIDEIPENPTSGSGKLYQTYIRKGFLSGSNFISISKKTQKDLHRFYDGVPRISEVVYNGLTRDFKPAVNIHTLRVRLGSHFGLNLTKGFILHVGGNQWYKNRSGVITIYDEWRQLQTPSLPLIMIGPSPNDSLNSRHKLSMFSKDIHFISDVEDEMVSNLYSCASLFLFPSLAEGFGWPIAEAMSSGCPVITTNEAPMNEVGLNAAFYIERMPSKEQKKWSEHSAQILQDVLSLPEERRNEVVRLGVKNATRFNSEKALDRIENIYKRIILA